MPQNGQTTRNRTAGERRALGPAMWFAIATATVAVALLALSWEGYTERSPLGLVLVSAAAFFCGARRVRVSRESTISTGCVIVFAALIGLGVPEACVAAALSGLAVVLFPPAHKPNPPVVIVFAAASLVVTAWVAGDIFLLVGGRPGATGVWNLGIPALASACVYHFVNCLLVGMIAHLASGAAPLAGLFRSHFSAGALPLTMGACWAVLIHLALTVSGVWVLLASLPPIYALHVALRERFQPSPYPVRAHHRRPRS